MNVLKYDATYSLFEYFKRRVTTAPPGEKSENPAPNGSRGLQHSRTSGSFYGQKLKSWQNPIFEKKIFQKYSDNEKLNKTSRNEVIEIRRLL